MSAADLKALEGEPSGLPPAEAVALVLAGLSSSSEWWTGRALHWIEQGVSSPTMVDSCRRVAGDHRRSEEIRTRAERMSRPQAFTAKADTFGPPGEGYFWARDIFYNRGWRAAVVTVPVLLGASLVVTIDGDPGAGAFFGVGAVAWAAYGFSRWEDRDDDRV